MKITPNVGELPSTSWKVVSRNDPRQGPIYRTEVSSTNWAIPIMPMERHGHSISGYHVFLTEEGAWAYAARLDAIDYEEYFCPPLTAIEVQVRGEHWLSWQWEDSGFPHTLWRNVSHGELYKGFIVESWRPIGWENIDKWSEKFLLL